MELHSLGERKAALGDWKKTLVEACTKNVEEYAATYKNIETCNKKCRYGSGVKNKMI